MYASLSSYEDLDYSGFGQGSGEAVRLEEFDIGGFR